MPDKPITPADYTVKIVNIPKEVTQEELIKWVEKFGTKKNPVKVRKVCRSHNISRFLTVAKQKEKMSRRITRGKNKEKLDKQLKLISYTMQEIRQKKIEYGPVAFVTLDHPKRNLA